MLLFSSLICLGNRKGLETLLIAKSSVVPNVQWLEAAHLQF